jgi:hypothetical protein
MSNELFKIEESEFYARLAEQTGKNGVELADHVLGLEKKSVISDLMLVDKLKSQANLNDTLNIIDSCMKREDAVAYMQVWCDVASELIDRGDCSAVSFSKIVLGLSEDAFPLLHKIMLVRPGGPDKFVKIEGFPSEEYRQSVSDFALRASELSEADIEDVLQTEKLHTLWGPMYRYYDNYINNTLNDHRKNEESFKAVAIGVLLMNEISKAKDNGFVPLKKQLVKK